MRQTNVRDTDQHHYTCEYCFTHFIPKRRPIQKCCSSSCRSKAYRQRTKNNAAVDGLAGLKPKKKKKDKTKIDKMSSARIGNSALGTGMALLAKEIFTKEENKPATKTDIQKLLQRFERYHRIRNMNVDPEGRAAFFDMQENVVVYRYDIKIYNQ